MIDLDRNVPTRFTSDPANEEWPVWSPDGADVVFCSNRQGVFNLYRRPSGGASTDELLYASADNKRPTGFSPDGDVLLFTTYSANSATGGGTVWALPLTARRPSKPFQVVEGNVGGAKFSPDGRWIAYHSTETGWPEVYVQPFPGTGEKVRLSNATGVWPEWTHDAKRIIYATIDSRFVSVDITLAAGAVRAGTPRQLFIQRQDIQLWRDFAVDASGERFVLVVAPNANQEPAPITVVMNWPALLRKPK